MDACALCRLEIWQSSLVNGPKQKNDIWPSASLSAIHHSSLDFLDCEFAYCPRSHFLFVKCWSNGKLPVVKGYVADYTQNNRHFLCGLFKSFTFYVFLCLLNTNFDQILVSSLHRLLNCKIGGLDCPLYTHVTPICNALVHVIYSGVSGQCSHTIPITYKFWYKLDIH